MMSAESAYSQPANECWFSSPEDLSTIHDDIWQRLQLAITDRSSGWRLPVLATVSDSGGFRQRIVVLRQVNADARLLVAHTDVRSDKVNAIHSHPSVSWLFYDHNQQVQLQMQGVATVHTTDEIADGVWQAETEASLRGYLAPLAPGTICDEPEYNLPEDTRHRVPSRKELQAARSRFAVIRCQIHSIEWLLLQRSGNLRARFRYEVDAVDCELNGTWVAP